MDVILLSNDVVPGSQVPVAAPGLRQWGLAQGLRANGIECQLVVPRHVADRIWSGMPAPSPEDALVLASNEVPELLRSRAPSVVVLTNSNQFDLVSGVPDTRLVYDFFAPKVLEVVGQPGSLVDEERLRGLRERKIRALAAADAVLVNGSKKLPYVLAWLLQGRSDVGEVPILQVPMCVPLGEAAPRSNPHPIRVGIAGYLQAWSVPGPWLDTVAAAVETGQIELHVLLPPHWGGGEVVPRSPSLAKLLSTPGVVEHGAKTYPEFQQFLGEMDLVLDLFDWSLEREYAMVTRTVVALASGRPVVHPTFTEVSSSIAAYEAGWLVDVHDDALATLLNDVFSSPEEVTRRAHNAVRLARDVFAPEVAVRPLVELLRSWSA